MQYLEARNEPHDEDNVLLLDMAFIMPHRGRKWDVSDSAATLRFLPRDARLTGLRPNQRSVRLPLLLRLALFRNNDDDDDVVDATGADDLPELASRFASHVCSATAIISGARVSVRAANRKIGPCFDWIALRGEGNAGEGAAAQTTWYAKLLLLFFTRGSVNGGHQRRQWMLIRYLEEVEVTRPHVVDAHHFAFAPMRLHVVELSTLLGRAAFAPSPRKLPDGRRVYLSLPYGKCEQLAADQ